MGSEDRSGPGSRKKRHSTSSTRSSSSRSSRRRKPKKSAQVSDILSENAVAYAPFVAAAFAFVLFVSSGGSKNEATNAGTAGIFPQSYSSSPGSDTQGSLYKEGILGQQCPWRGECGFGMECKNGLCTLDHSKPWKHLRQVTDQGFCDCAAAIAVAHTIDDRRIAQTSSTLSSNDFTSIRYLRDCVAGENYAKFEGALVGCEGGNVTGTFDKYKTHGAPFEWKVGYKMREEKCDGGNARRQNHVVRGGIQENCLTIQDIKGQVKSYGPVLHHIKVHKELYSYPTVYSLQGPVKKEILEYDDFQDDEFDGFTTIEIAGFGTDNKKGVKYLVIKTSWGPNYGINKGYLQVSEQAFERFMLPKCGIERKYDWNGEHNEELKGKWFKFPIIYYSIKKSDPLWENLKTTIQHDIEQVLHFRRKIAMARPVNVHITDESLKVQEAEEEFPKLKYAINSVFHYLKRKYRNEDYKFEFDTLVQADLSIVAGRRISLILKVRRNRNSKSKVVISDEGFVKAIVWIPLDSSKGGEDRKRIYHFEDACDPNPHLRKKAKYYMVDLEEVFERESTKIAEDVPRSTMLFKISVIMAVGFLLAANNCWNW